MHQTLRTSLTCLQNDPASVDASAPPEASCKNQQTSKLQNISPANNLWPKATSPVYLNRQTMYSFLPFRQLRVERKVSVRLGLMALMLVSLFFGGMQKAHAQYLQNVGPVTVTTDKPDYAPRSNAVFTGTGFQPGETVTLKVKNLFRACNTLTTDSSYTPWTVIADGSGGFVTNWTVCDCNGDSLRLRAVGQTSHDTAYAYFSDAVTVYPNALSINTTSDQSVCVGKTSTTLVATMTTCSNGGGTPINQTNVTYTWYYNTSATNDISGATLVRTFNTTTATLSDSYTPPTTSAEAGTTRYYFCQITFIPQGNGNGCGGSGRAGYPYTTSVDKVTVNALPNSPTAVNYSNSYDGNSHTASVTVGSGEIVDWYADATGNTTAAAPSGTNVGTYTAYAEARNSTTGCISSSRTKVTVTIKKATPTVTVTPYSVTYDGQPHTATYTISGVNGETGATVGTIDVTGTTHTNAGTYAADAWSFTGAANYKDASGTVSDEIKKRQITITPSAGQFKFCGQQDPTFDYTPSEVLLPGNGFTGQLSRVAGESVGSSYAYILGTLSAGNNYSLTLVGTNTFTIKASMIDASASSTAVPVGSLTGATLKAMVTSDGISPISGAMVYFTIKNASNVTVGTGSASSGLDGYASTTFNVSSLPVGVYAVKAVVGTGCDEDYGYLTLYDQTSSFVTGGGWILSPKGAYTANENLTGKANFGFVAKYKKGSNTVDGNTEFQFSEGDFNFKSNLLDAGTLVISGSKATYRGVGTVNGIGNYGFMVSAIDGEINGSSNVDKFRIKIWDKNSGNAVVYDNQINSLENADPTTLLGGGSIVIHEVKSTKPAAFVSRDQQIDVTAISKLGLQAYPNPAISQFTIKVTGNNTRDAITMIVYNQMGQVVDVKRNLTSGQTIQVGAAYTQGTYFVEVIQGDKRERLQVVKTN